MAQLKIDLFAIAERARARVAQRKAKVPVDQLREQIADLPKPRPFATAFSKEAGILAEIKFASPSLGPIAAASTLAPVEIAADYLTNGARALSVLTEPEFFNGSPDYLKAIRQAHPEAKLLMKDFFVDDYQITEARSFGADAVLLIVALLGETRCRELAARADSLGLEMLYEVHDAQELRIAEACGASLIGVNNRDLKTMKVSVDTSLRLADQFRSSAIRISESGLSTATELETLSKAGYSGFLIGSAFMQTGQPGIALAKLRAQTRFCVVR